MQTRNEFEKQVPRGSQEDPQNPQQADDEGSEKEDQVIEREIPTKSLLHRRGWDRLGRRSSAVGMATQRNSVPTDADF